MKEYDFANDKNIKDNACIVLDSECNRLLDLQKRCLTNEAFCLLCAGWNKAGEEVKERSREICWS